MKNKAEETGIAKAPEPGALVPIKMDMAEMQEMYGDMESNDIAVPRIVVLQGLSPEVSEGHGKPGDFYIKGLERNLGGSPLEVVILMRNKSRLRWQDLTLGGGILCRSSDAKIGVGDPGGPCDACPYSQWEVSSDNKSGRPGCDIYQNLIVALRNDDDWFPMSLSGNRTKLKPLKNLNALLMVEMGKGRPLFSKSYIVEAISQTNRQGMKYFSFRVSPGNGNVPLPQEEQQKAFTLFKSLKGKNIEIHQDREESAVEPLTDI